MADAMMLDRHLFALAEVAAKFATVDRATMLADGVAPESDTDHTVMLGLIACELADRLGYETAALNRGLIAAFALVHDLPEVYAGDANTLTITPQERIEKERREADAARRLAEQFGPRSWVINTLAAYESQSTPEARFVKLVDKMMPKFTHEMNRGAAFVALGKTAAEIEAAHHVQISTLRNKYGKEFPAVIALIEATMERAVNVYRKALARPVLPEVPDASVASEGPGVESGSSSDERVRE